MIHRASCGPESDPSSPSSSPKPHGRRWHRASAGRRVFTRPRAARSAYGNKQLAAHRRPLARASALARSPAARSSQRFAWSPACGRTQIRAADSLDQANASSQARPASLHASHTARFHRTFFPQRSAESASPSAHSSTSSLALRTLASQRPKPTRAFALVYLRFAPIFRRRPARSTAGHADRHRCNDARNSPLRMAQIFRIGRSRPGSFPARIRSPSPNARPSSCNLTVALREMVTTYGSRQPALGHHY